MTKSDHLNGSKSSSRLRDIKVENEAKHQDQLAPAAEESGPSIEELKFQKDLDYLLNNEDGVVIDSEVSTLVAFNGVDETQMKVVAQGKGKSRKSKSPKHLDTPKTVRVEDVIEDLGELQFSSDEEDATNSGSKSASSKSTPRKKRNRKSKKKASKNPLQEFENGVHVENAPSPSKNGSAINENTQEVEGKPTSNGNADPRGSNSTDNLKEKSNITPKKARRKKSRKVLSKDLEGMHQQNGEGIAAPPATPSKSLAKKKSRAKKLNSLQGPDEVHRNKDVEANCIVQPTQQSSTIDSTKSHEETPKKSRKSPRKRNRAKSEPRKSVGEPSVSASDDAANSNVIKDSSKSEAREDLDQVPELNGSTSNIEESGSVSGTSDSGEASANCSPSKRSLKSSPRVQPNGDELGLSRKSSSSLVDQERLKTKNSVSSLFGITLKSLKSSSSNKSEHMPEVSPIKTIIGVSHQQILTADLTDVKLKTIMNAPSISKYAANSMKFVKKYEDEVFNNIDLKKEFLLLCINVALYESEGFKKSVNENKDILDHFGHYEELNLENTHTSITASEKTLHRNTLDYSMFAYFGHILIWALHLQRKATIPSFINEYGLTLSPDEIKMKIGGRHLWDKIFRELKGMNSKRWKHVLKFRNMFPFEEDQFMVILRFMKITNIP
ncbi:hypothetical protein I9W82_000781 [Candida metapsilosis]|uniref:Uncharacterized protein n=1 Tax=Candida metapsilosis TaxID=273372 RepID=A0A8H7ZJ72_9ASCO|nr:hypothetical protein I9W82_000781 [Candida metapsilosis]